MQNLHLKQQTHASMNQEHLLKMADHLNALPRVTICVTIKNIVFQAQKSFYHTQFHALLLNVIKRN